MKRAVAGLAGRQAGRFERKGAFDRTRTMLPRTSVETRQWLRRVAHAAEAWAPLAGRSQGKATVMWFTLAFIVCFLAGHLPAIRREEAHLARRWPEPHEAYQQRVPALFPTLQQLRQRHPIYPRRLKDAIWREADAVCGWIVAGLGLEIWEDIAATPAQSDVAEASALTALALLQLVAWLLLKLKPPIDLAVGGGGT